MLRKIFSTAPPASAYAAAAFLALAAALFSALGLRLGDGRERGAIAVVNGEIVPDAEYARALDAMQAGLERELTNEDRTRALNILIDEELIVQHALDLDIARNDRLARKTLIQALIRSSLVLDGPAEPSDIDLRRLFEAERQLFASSVFVTVKIAKAPENGAGVDAFKQAIATGTPFDEAGALTGFRDMSPPPQLPLGKLADYAGASIRDVVLAMTPGDIAGPVPYGAQVVFIWLTERTGGEVPDFEAVRDAVTAEWTRRREEAAFERYMKRLRRKAQIRKFIDPEAE